MMVNQCMFAALYGTMYYSKEGGQYAYAAVICMLFLCIGGKSIVTIVTAVVTIGGQSICVYFQISNSYFLIHTLLYVDPFTRAFETFCGPMSQFTNEC